MSLYPTFARLTAIMSPLPLLLSLATAAPASVLVHETFFDDDIMDGSPAVWHGTCFQWECGPDPPTADYSIENGEFDLTIRDMAMWRLVEADGVAVEPSNHWSVRARIESHPGPESSIAGVGTDRYYWAAGMRLSSNLNVAQLGSGQFGNSVGSPNSFSPFDDWIVQLDVYPDHLESHMWSASDPSTVASTTWSNGSTVVPGLPVFWGNWHGTSTFHEVVVATEPMGVGGDFDRDGELHLLDVEALSDAIRSRSNDPRYNLTPDEVVDALDLDVWVHQIKKTYFGDANLDGQVNSNDLNALALNWQRTNADSWSQGDFNGDSIVNAVDLNALALNWRSGVDAPAARAAVPEPAGVLLLGMGLVGRVVHRQRRP